MLELNKIYCMDCVEGMKLMSSGFIDLTVTSPPYDNLRDYKGYTFDFESIAKELYRITKEGGVVVWVIGDQVVNGSESGQSFEQALYFKKIGFNLHDTMIYQKDSISFPERNRYNQIFEYMFIFSKGKPKTTNIIRDKKNKWSDGKKHIKGHYRTTNNEIKRHHKENILKEFGARYNIWIIATGCNKSHTDKYGYEHPATFPEQLANDHIISWSNEDDIVFDPMCGSGTTCKMAKLLRRNFIGFEISQEYVDLGNDRIKEIVSIPKTFDDKESKLW